jgi:hypothetical protein
MAATQRDDHLTQTSQVNLRFLDIEQVRQIDKALAEMSDFGEVRLIKAKGKLRFIQTLESQEMPDSKRRPDS